MSKRPAPNPTPEEPLGVGGERRHKWAFGSEEDGEYLREAVATLGASRARPTLGASRARLAIGALTMAALPPR